MAATDLLVLIIRDSGLRSTLIGRLSLAGESLLTFDGGIDDPALERAVRRPAILITDVVDPAAPPSVLRQDDRWHSVIVLADKIDGVTDDAPFRILDKRHAVTGVPEVLALLRAAA